MSFSVGYVFLLPWRVWPSLRWVNDHPFGIFVFHRKITWMPMFMQNVPVILMSVNVLMVVHPRKLTCRTWRYPQKRKGETSRYKPPIFCRFQPVVFRGAGWSVLGWVGSCESAWMTFSSAPRIGNAAVGKDIFSDPRNPTNHRNFGWLDWVLKFGSLGSWSFWGVEVQGLTADGWDLHLFLFGDLETW